MTIGGIKLNFGFSYTGLIFLIMLFIPNILWAKRKPKDYEKFAANENKLLLAFERTGEFLVSGLCLIFKDFNIGKISVWSSFLAAGVLLMFLYEFYWLRYFMSKRTMSDMYSSILGIPVAGASLPVGAFMLLGIYGKNIPLIVSVIILGIGHIGIHYNHKKEIKENYYDNF